MNQGTILGSQIGRWIILAALVVVLGALLLTIRPVAAQTEGCQTVGTTGANKKAVCYYEFVEHGTGQVATLSALERDYNSGRKGLGIGHRRERPGRQTRPI